MKKLAKALFTIICILLIGLLVLYVFFGGQVRTVASVKKVDEGIYQAKYSADYKLDDLLKADVGSIDEFMSWISDNMFFGLPLDAVYSRFACTAFIAQNPEGDYIMGRNYDYVKTDTMLVYSAPEDGYESIAVSDLHLMGVGSLPITSADGPYGKLVSLVSPYTITEGVNEKGLGVAILELKDKEIHQDNGKPDVLLFVAVRMLLDKAANVDEAVKMLGDYDIHTFFNSSFHLFISDSSGDSAVVEWIDGKMNVLDEKYVTNFQLSKGEGYGKGAGQQRYETVKKKLAETDSILTEEEAMSLLRDARIDWNGKWGTQWSVVTNLKNFSLDICLDNNFEKVYEFSKESF